MNKQTIDIVEIDFIEQEISIIEGPDTLGFIPGIEIRIESVDKKRFSQYEVVSHLPGSGKMTLKHLWSMVAP